MNISTIKFNGLSWWPLFQYLKTRHGIKPKHEDVDTAVHNVARMTQGQQIATFIIIGRLFAEIEEFDRIRERNKKKMNQF